MQYFFPWTPKELEASEHSQCIYNLLAEVLTVEAFKFQCFMFDSCKGNEPLIAYSLSLAVSSLKYVFTTARFSREFPWLNTTL